MLRSHRSILPAGGAHSSKPAACCCSSRQMEETDRQMDTRQFHRPCSALLCQQLLVLLHLFNSLFSKTTWVSRYQKGKTSLDLNEARDDGVLGCSSISWTICKQPALHSRQITTPTPHHSIFTGRMLFRQQCQSIEGTQCEQGQ